MKTIDKETLAGIVSSEIGTEKKLAAAMIDSLVHAIKIEVRKGNNVVIRKFGSFGTKLSKKGVSNLTGVSVKLKRVKVAYFKPSREDFKFV